tara:strand:- start:95 stop:448 length:354 start_codon:yes stop_codon:yes gene_type:complete
MEPTNIQTNTNFNQFRINNFRSNIPDNVANNMPNGLVKVSEPQNNKNIDNNIKNSNLRQIYSPRFAPSSGSLTENFLKSRSNLTPIFRFNEASIKYEMISVAPINLTKIKRNIDLII